jgi:hypothetical protein
MPHLTSLKLPPLLQFVPAPTVAPIFLFGNTTGAPSNDTSARRALVARDLAAHGALADGGAPARTPSLHHAIAGWQPGARKRMTASSLTVLGVGFRLRITLISS